MAFYSDKHSIFRVAREGSRGRDKGVTQFGRALAELSIEIICANTPQAKGRVERMNKTLQDRLVKELRLAGASQLWPTGNALLPAFIADYNARFAKSPANAKDLHRPLHAGDDLEDAFRLEGGAHAVAGTDPPIRQGDLCFGTERAGQGGDRQAGHRGSIIPMAGYRSVTRVWSLPTTRTFDKLRQVFAGRDSPEQAAQRRSRLHP